jgi:hypothetical protein
MSVPVREAILSAFAAHLAARLHPTKVDRNREVPTSLAEHSEYVNILDGPQSEPDEGMVIGYATYVMTPRVEGYVACPLESVGPALNDLYGRVVKAALSDRGLGNLTQDIVEGAMEEVAIFRERGTQPGGGFALDFYFTFRTLAGDPTVLG